MKRINLLVTLALAAIIINGCSADEADRYASKNFAAVGGEEIVGEDFGSLALLLGNPTKQDMLNVAGDALGRLNMMAEIGKYNPAYPELSADYQNVVDLMGRAHDMMVEKQIIYYEELAAEARGEGAKSEDKKACEELCLDDYAKLFGIEPVWDKGKSKSWLGDKLLDDGAYDLASMIANIDSVNVYAMLEHLMLQDAETVLYPAFSGIKIAGFDSDEDAQKVQESLVGLVGGLHGMLPFVCNELLPAMNMEKDNGSVEIPLAENSKIKIPLEDLLEIITVSQLVDVVGGLLEMVAGMDLSTKDENVSILVPWLMGKIQEQLDTLPVVIEIDSMKPLLGALLTGEDNPFMDNVKVLLLEAMDIQDDVYNPDGTIVGHANLRTFLDYLIYNEDMDVQKVVKYEYKGNIYKQGEKPVESVTYLVGPITGIRYPFVTRSSKKIEDIKGVTQLNADKGMLSMKYMVVGLYDLTDEKSVDNLWNAICWIVDPKCLVWELLGIDTTVKWPVQVSDILGMDPNECLVTLPFVQGMFTDYPGDGYEGSLVEWGMNGLDLDGKGFGQYGAMRTLMTNIVDLGSVDLGEAMGPDTEGYKFAMGMLEMVSKRARP